MKKICFCALSAYPLLVNTDIQFIGGAELQQVLIAKELNRRGYEVAFIVFDHGQPPLEEINGISIFKTIPPRSTFRNTRTMFIALRTIWNSLKKANADIYFQECSGFLTGVIALFCQIYNKKFIYQLASDMDIDQKYLKEMGTFSRWAYRFGLKKAHRIIAQSIFQKDLVQKNLSLDAIIIKNPIQISRDKIPKKSEPPIVLWVGTIKPNWKQPEVFLRLAREIPHAKFQMIGGAAANQEYYKNIEREAKTLSNLEFLGFVSHHKKMECFKNASILVNTSSVEGFSYTFLEAWENYVPVVSLNIDPDEIICKYSLGYHSKEFKRLIQDVKELVYDKSKREYMGKKGREYVEKEHEIGTVIDKYSLIFDSM